MLGGVRAIKFRFWELNLKIHEKTWKSWFWAQNPLFKGFRSALLPGLKRGKMSLFCWKQAKIIRLWLEITSKGVWHVFEPSGKCVELYICENVEIWRKSRFRNLFYRHAKLFQGQFICVLSISKLRTTVSHDLAKISRCAHIVKIRILSIKFEFYH